MNSISWGDAEDLLREKLRQLKQLQEVKTSDLVGDYLIHFILLVNKIMAKSEEAKRGEELKQERQKKKKIEESIHEIKQKLSQNKHGESFKREEMSPQQDGWRVLNGGDDLREKLPDEATPEGGNSAGQGDKKCNVAQLCEDLTEGFHLCISLLLRGMKGGGGKPIEEEGDGDVGEADRKEQSGASSGGVSSNGVRSSDVGSSGDLISGNPFRGDCPAARREGGAFHLSLLYLALCFYHMHLVSGDREKHHHLHVSLFLLLVSFPHLKDSEIEHYVCVDGKVCLRFDVSVARLLSRVCKMVGLNCKRAGDAHACLFFLTHSCFFLQYAHKGGAVNWEQRAIAGEAADGEHNGSHNPAGGRKKHKYLQNMINLVEHINQVFLECNFFTASTLLSMRSIGLHSSLLKSDIEEVRREECREECSSTLLIESKEPVVGTPKESPPDDELVYLNEELTQEDFHFYGDPVFSGAGEGEKRTDTQIEKKLNKIIETATSLFESISECSYLFLDLHLLSIYEHLVLFCLYMSKDVSKLLHQFKGEKKKKKISQRYEYMAYRNLLEIYIIFLKHNYLRYKKSGGGEEEEDSTYVRACQIYGRMEEVKRTIRSLLQGCGGRSDTHVGSPPVERKKGNIGNRQNGGNPPKSCIKGEYFHTREHFRRNKICIRAGVSGQGEDALGAASYLESTIQVRPSDVKTISNEEPTHYSSRGKTPSKLLGDVFSLVGDSNIAYEFIREHIVGSNTFNFEADEEADEAADEAAEGELGRSQHALPGANGPMSFSAFLRGSIKRVGGSVGEVFSQVWAHAKEVKEVKEATAAVEVNEAMAADATTVTAATATAATTAATPWANVHLADHAADLLQTFQFKRVSLSHMQFDVCNFGHAEYAKLATDKMKKLYRRFSKGRANQQSEQWHLPSLGTPHGGAHPTCTGHCKHAHYLCRNFDEIQFLFKKIKKYKKKTLAYFSLHEETTLHLDILLNSSESYFYFNFFTNSHEQYMQNCRHMLNCISAPLAQITHPQYLSFQREMALKCALILKDIFICLKCNTRMDNMHTNDLNRNRSLSFDDHIGGPLTAQEKGIIRQAVQYYLFFLGTYQIGGESTNAASIDAASTNAASTNAASTNAALTNAASPFQSEEEKKSYFDIFFYVCKTLSTVNDRSFVEQALHLYQRLLSYAAKNKMYADERYNEYMRDVCRKSICVLRGRMLDLG
ncbi:hypothetical protein PVNG_04872 [Plasmodium vivax North Korean]|uniref:Uncharacterized protein n=1 Tax=Plasmodium vivax North Korean TaxID=1035514 RepID=A0A0J9TTW3_PLAVI|nr:hypothetical protein PVNG_04872 [Plasmodium vivax North Korean]